MRPDLLQVSVFAGLFLGLGGGVPSGFVGPAVPRPVHAITAMAADSSAASGAPAAARAARVAQALDVLVKQVGELSHPAALRFAFEAYYGFKAAHPQQVRRPYLYFVDFGLDSRTPRGYVFDMLSLRVVDGPFTVAHGRGSDNGRDGVPERFSNLPGSNATSLGLYLGEELYGFSGSSGGSPYHSVGLRLSGLSGSFNGAARERRVVAHGAPYVTPDKAGQSEGCPAMEPWRAERLLPLISNGGLVFLFSPLDPRWMREDPWARSAAGPFPEERPVLPAAPPILGS